MNYKLLVNLCIIIIILKIEMISQISFDKYCIIPNKHTLCEGNGLEIHDLETELILPVFKAKLYHY